MGKITSQGPGSPFMVLGRFAVPIPGEMLPGPGFSSQGILNKALARAEKAKQGLISPSPVPVMFYLHVYPQLHLWELSGIRLYSVSASTRGLVRIGRTLEDSSIGKDMMNKTPITKNQQLGSHLVKKASTHQEKTPTEGRDNSH